MSARWAALAGVLVAGCGAVAPEPSAVTNGGEAQARHEAGRRIYNFRCYYCHGYSGDAHTLAATFLSPPPRNFRVAEPATLPRSSLEAVVAHGRPGTAMQGFANVLNGAEIAAVAEFVYAEFVVAKAPNTRYHTADNGWPEHERYRIAYPFATGEMALDVKDDTLDDLHRAGRRLFLATCVSCHDRGRVADEGPIWEARPLSYPRNGFAPEFVSNPPSAPIDALSGASPYRIHDRAPSLASLTPAERRGERLYQDNCAFCHAADGTGKNWIGSFLEPHPRDLTSALAMTGMTRARLGATIAEGLPGTSMPAWKAVLGREEIGAVVAYVGRAFHPLRE